jgi:hypothetical protein
VLDNEHLGVRVPVHRGQCRDRSEPE